MTITTHTELDPLRREAARELWNNEYPESLELEAPMDFDEYLNRLSEQLHYLVKDDSGVVKGWAMTFRRDDETWFAMILDQAIHGKGIGSQLLQRMKAGHDGLLGWAIDHEQAIKADGSNYRSPLAFYSKNDFSVDADIRLETPVISAVRVSWNRHS